MKNLSLLAFAFLLFSCGGGEQSLESLKTKKKELKAELLTIEQQIKALDTASSQIQLPLVTVDSVRNMPFSHKVKFQGFVEADKNVFVYPEAGGLITSIKVKDGQKIMAGAVIATIDYEIISKNIQEVEKGLELAKYMLEKQENLKKQGVGVGVQYEQAKNQKESLEKKLETLKAQAGKSVVRAPFTGFVDEVMMEQGQLAGPQTPILRMLDISKVTLKSEVSEKYLLDISQGTKVSASFPSIDYQMNNLSVSRTTKFINASNRTFNIEIDIQNVGEKILPNLYAEVLVQDHFNPMAKVIPSKSILEDKDGNKYVYVLNPSTSQAQKRSVEVESVEGEMAELKESSSVSANDIIIVGGARAISEGTTVKVSKNS